MMQGCWTEMKSGNFKSYARWFGVIDVTLMMAVPILCVITFRVLPIITFILLIVFSVIAGVVELPMCCGCLQCCRWVGARMSLFKHFLFRALMYAAMSAILLVVAALVENEGSPATWFFGISNGINCLLYLVANCKGEVAGDEAADEGMVRDAARAKVREQAMKAASNPDNQQAAINVAKSNPEFAAAALRAASRV